MDRGPLVERVRRLLALADSDRPDKRIVVSIRKKGDDRAQISVVDNGVGIAKENLARIFSFGFTTRDEGHGYGLHSAANVAGELGGTLSVQSDGPGKGAIFTVILPFKTQEAKK